MTLQTIAPKLLDDRCVSLPKVRTAHESGLSHGVSGVPASSHRIVWIHLILDFQDVPILSIDMPVLSMAIYLSTLGFIPIRGADLQFEPHQLALE